MDRHGKNSRALVHCFEILPKWRSWNDDLVDSLVFKLFSDDVSTGLCAVDDFESVNGGNMAGETGDLFENLPYCCFHTEQAFGRSSWQVYQHNPTPHRLSFVRYLSRVSADVCCCDSLFVVLHRDGIFFPLRHDSYNSFLPRCWRYQLAWLQIVFLVSTSSKQMPIVEMGPDRFLSPSNRT